jgi:hypothetical protein
MQNPGRFTSEALRSPTTMTSQISYTNDLTDPSTVQVYVFSGGILPGTC